jgi:predicted GIY-YIG superfamily endonuclease
MTGFHYVYILESEANPLHHYTGLTDDLAVRLQTHNAGGCPHTLNSGRGGSIWPWRSGRVNRPRNLSAI